MKNLSVKFKITLWYTVFMTLLIFAVIWLLFSVGSSRVLSDARFRLQSVVLSSYEEITYAEGILDMGNAFVSPAEGIYLSAYDDAGNLLFGTSPLSYEDASVLIMDEFQQLKNNDAGTSWYLYDYCQYLEGYGNLWVRGVVSQTQTDTALRTLVRLSLILLPFFVLCVAGGGYYITRRALAPLAGMTDTALRITKGNDLSERIRLGEGQDEVHKLAHTFDQMMDKLQVSFENEKQFTSDVSHELRTPVTVILSECEYACREDLNAQEARSCLDIIHAQARKMSGLIAQLLMLARADSGKHQLQLELLNLSELAGIVAEEQKSLAVSENITLDTQIQPDIMIQADETMMMRLLMNLLSNSIAYGRRNGHILLSLSADETTVTISVTDDGIGISADQLEHIWKRFYQADPSRSSSKTGAGLGLPMVKWIAQVHGGTVSVTSTPDEGSCFSVFLPKKENF